MTILLSNGVWKTSSILCWVLNALLMQSKEEVAVAASEDADELALM